MFLLANLNVQPCVCWAFHGKFRPTVTPHKCQCQYCVSFASLSRQQSSAPTPCPRSLQTPSCAHAPYGSSTFANFPPSACPLYLDTEARSLLDSDHNPSPCRSRDISDVNLQPAEHRVLLNHHAKKQLNLLMLRGQITPLPIFLESSLPCAVFLSVSFLSCINAPLLSTPPFLFFLPPPFSLSPSSLLSSALLTPLLSLANGCSPTVCLRRKQIWMKNGDKRGNKEAIKSTKHKETHVCWKCIV